MTGSLLRVSPVATGAVVNLVAWQNAAMTGDPSNAVLTTVWSGLIPLIGLAINYVGATYGPLVKQWLVNLMAERERIRSESISGRLEALLTAHTETTAQLQTANLLVESLTRQLATQSQSYRDQIEQLVDRFEAATREQSAKLDKLTQVNHALRNAAVASPQYLEAIDRKIDEIQGVVRSNADVLRRNAGKVDSMAQTSDKVDQVISAVQIPRPVQEPSP